MTDGPTDLEAAFASADATIARALGDRGPDARHATLATIGPDGWPEARTVALRHADLGARWLVIQTDLATAKVSAIRHLPRAEVHVWHPETCLQLRARCQVTLRAGPDVAAEWQGMPPAARQSYGKSPPAGTAIDDSLAYRVTADPAALAVLDLRVDRFDLLYLGTVHRRAVFEAGTADTDGWNGRWISP